MMMITMMVVLVMMTMTMSGLDDDKSNEGLLTMI